MTFDRCWSCIQDVCFGDDCIHCCTSWDLLSSYAKGLDAMRRYYYHHLHILHRAHISETPICIVHNNRNGGGVHAGVRKFFFYLRSQTSQTIAHRQNRRAISYVFKKYYAVSIDWLLFNDFSCLSSISNWRNAVEGGSHELEVQSASKWWYKSRK